MGKQPPVQAGHRRDVVVVGASAGGVEALSSLVAALPADLDAAVFVVLHVRPSGPSMLPHILARHARLEVVAPRGGEPIRHGRVYVAPPDRHLLLTPHRVRLGAGSAEGGHRPGIDTLFRSAAEAFGERVIAVVLTGTRNDGSAGLVEVKRHGGLALVQDPAGAAHPGMPESAIAAVDVDEILGLEEMGPALARLVAERPEPRVAPEMPSLENPIRHHAGAPHGSVDGQS